MNTSQRFASNCFRILLAITALHACSCGNNPIGPVGGSSPYGDGSQGSVVVTSNTNIFTLVPSGNLQFRDFTVDPGVTLTVPSGTLLRCTGAVTINGTVDVEFGTTGGYYFNGSGNDPGAGNSQAPAHNGMGNPTGEGGEGGYGLTFGQAASILNTGPFGGGAGGGAPPVGHGGNGGGAFTILASRPISVAGGIYADGQAASDPGGGGGAGGIVVLASAERVDIPGVVAARGANGANAGPSNAAQLSGAGGGGGGGIIHLVSPAITIPGSLLTTNGKHGVGPSTGSASPTNKYGGGGGGACGGPGGMGGSCSILSQTGGSNGFTGVEFQTLADPTDLF